MTPYVILASFLSGLLGAMGIGGGSVLIIYLTTFLSLEQKNAQGINLLFFIATGIFALISNIKKGLVDKKLFLKLMPTAAAGMLLGFIILPRIATALLKKLFGGILLILGVKTLFEKRSKE